MSPKSVKVPEPFEDLFSHAETVVDKFFSQRQDNPEEGSIEIFGSRYVLMRGAALSIDFYNMVRNMFGEEGETEADVFASRLLYDLAHSVGISDAKNFAEKMELEDPVAKLSAGPIHFAYTGWAFVDILPESQPAPDDNYYLIYDHPYSFESDAWIRAGKSAPCPICSMNAGYSSGWCESSFGLPLVSTELSCKAYGDEHCRFIMAPPHKIEEHIDRYLNDHQELGERKAILRIPKLGGENSAPDRSDMTANTAAERRIMGYAREMEQSQALLKRKLAELQTEIEAREKAEDGLRSAAAVVESTPSGLITCDLDDEGELIILSMNPSAEVIIASSASFMIGRKLSEVLPDSSKVGLLRGLKEALLAGETWHGEDQPDHSEANWRSLRYSGFKIGDGQVAISLEDITHWRRAQKLIERTNDDLQQLVKDHTQRLQEANSQLLNEIKQREKTESQLLTTIKKYQSRQIKPGDVG